MFTVRRLAEKVGNMNWLKEFDTLANEADVNNPLFLAFACEAISRLKNDNYINDFCASCLMPINGLCKCESPVHVITAAEHSAHLTALRRGLALSLLFNVVLLAMALVVIGVR